MNSFLEKAGRLWFEFSSRLSSRRETASIDNVAKLADFVTSRSAHVGQKALYGYVKARMGTRYPRMFEDDALMASLDISKRHVFAGCLSDLTIFAVTTALNGAPVGDDERGAMAREVYESGLRAGTSDAPDQFSVPDSLNEFEQRLGWTDWNGKALQPDNFTQSPRALYRWAPIAENLKKLDTEMIENSIRFAWREVREDFRNRVDPRAVTADWQQQKGAVRPATG